MPIPQAVQKQGERADQLAREAGLSGVPPVPASQQSQQPSQQAPAPSHQSEPAPKPSQESAQPAPKPNEDYKTRYENLRHSRDERRLELERHNGVLQGKLEMITGEMSQLRQEIERMRNAPAPQPTSVPSVGPADVSQFLTEEEAEYFSPEALAIISKVASRAAQGVVVNEVAPMRTQLEGVQRKQHETDDQYFWRMIGSEIPYWRELTNVPEFEDYMAERDPLLGMTRQQAVNEAQESLNHERIIAIYRQYTGPRPSHVDDHDDAPEPPIHPDNASSSGEHLESDDGPTFTKSQVDKFYNDVANKRYVGREGECARIEAQILAAAREGRILPG